MSEQKHIIKRQTFELTVQDPAEARRLQNEMSRIYRQRIVPLIDRYCTELSQPDRLHRIESLEVDLGYIDPGQFEADLVTKLGPALREALARQIEAQEQVANRQARSPKTASQLELFAFFARTGSLPWWADASQPQLLDECLQYLRRSAPEPLRRLMRALGGERQPLLRLVHHYRDEHLAGLAGLLAPALETAISRDSQGLLLALQETNVATGRRPAQLRQTLWTNILRVAGLEGQQAAALEPFYQAVLTRLAADLGLTYRALIADLRRVVQEDSGRLPVELRDTLKSLDQALTRLDVPQSEEIEVSRQLARLQATSGPLADLGTVLQILAPRFPAAIRTEWLAALNAVDGDLAILNEVSPEAVQRMLKLLHSGLTRQSLQQIPSAERRRLLAALRALAGLELLAGELAELPQKLGEIVSRETASAAEADDAPLDHGFSEAEELFIGNAGLVILWPFLSHFFARLGLLADKQFKDSAARQRAVGLLQYVATDASSFPEYLLPLNKVLCGLELAEVFDFGPPLSEPEAEECTNLLTAVIEQAPILRDMSAPGFRGTFLLRPGVLSSRDGAWLLRVERETYDIVLDRFPWSWAWVKLPWMEAPLRVEW